MSGYQSDFARRTAVANNNTAWFVVALSMGWLLVAVLAGLYCGALLLQASGSQNMLDNAAAYSRCTAIACLCLASGVAVLVIQGAVRAITRPER